MRQSFFLSLLCLALNATASTTISSPTVSGNWTLAGSPYMVNNNITIDAGQALTIDPGVQVLFTGAYMVQVNGILKASGTATSPITFNRSDTTGFSTILTSSAGGWHGIYFAEYAGTSPDSSVLKHCNMRYTKFDAADLDAFGTLTVRRPLSVQSCDFSYCKNTPGSGFTVVTVFTYATDLVQFDSCTISNCNSDGMIVYTSGYAGGTTQIRNSVVSRNVCTSGTVYSALTDLVFQNNKVFENDLSSGVSGAGILTIIGYHALIKGNYIHDNVNKEDAAIDCTGGFVDIDGNKITNNYHTSGFCGAADGGGAINVGFNSPVSADSTAYIIRNNVIANNYSPFHGGAINIIRASTTISNNQIINNKSINGAAVYIRSLTASNVLKIKNNIFFGNTQDTGTALTSPDVIGDWDGTVCYENNWSQHTPTFNLASIMVWGLHLFGDTTTNIVGTNPRLVAPTVTANYTEDAGPANFSLMPSSGCIDRGDTANAESTSLDYAANARIFGTRIDIGAYEFNPAIYALQAPHSAFQQTKFQLYPNPAYNKITILGPEKITEITITNLLGKILYRTKNDSRLTTIDVSDLPAGIYLLHINDNEVKKFSKE